MLKSDNYSGNISKIEGYLKKWNIDHDSIRITVTDGSWSIEAYGHCNILKRYIISNAPKWLFFCKDWANAKIIYHEYLHILGIIECKSNWFIRMFCIMYENDESRLKELFVKPFQLLNRIKPCKNCKKFQDMKEKNNRSE